MEIRPIRTQTDYQEALKEIELLFDAAPNTPEYDRLDVLSTLVDAYEKVHFPIEIPVRSKQSSTIWTAVDGLAMIWNHVWAVELEFPRF